MRAPARPGTGPDGLIKSDTPRMWRLLPLMCCNRTNHATPLHKTAVEHLDDGGVGASVPSVVVYQAWCRHCRRWRARGSMRRRRGCSLVGVRSLAEQLDASWAAFRTSWDKVINPRLALIGFQAAGCTNGPYQVVRALQKRVEQVHDRITSLQSQPSPPTRGTGRRRGVRRTSSCPMTSPRGFSTSSRRPATPNLDRRASPYRQGVWLTTPPMPKPAESTRWSLTSRRLGDFAVAGADAGG